jgi:RNA recognition motif-containing protein
VKNLNFQTSEEVLKKHLLKAGETKSVKIIKDKGGNPLGYGFV